MENSLRPSSKLSKCSRSIDIYLADRISQLPDEILESILSCLTMREAVRTSILSRRWKDLWTYTTGSLDFDFGSAALIMSRKVRRNVFEILEPEIAGYIRRVNKLLNSHKGSTIESFRVELELKSSAGPDIDSWIKFAIRKRVRRLELDLGPVGISWGYYGPFAVMIVKDCYHFPALESIDNKSNINWLTSLNFNCVDMTGEFLEYLLSNCPFLEYVRILNSYSLVGARVVAPCRKLKHLEIAHCHHLEFLDISSAVNLTSLSYSGPKETRLCFRNVPSLADVSLGGCYCLDIVKRFRELPLALSQIEKLQLSFYASVVPHFGKFPKLKKVKQLELEFKAVDHHSLLSCANAINACPSLYRLSVLFNWLRVTKQRDVEQPKRRRRRSHKLLKVVELRGFRASTTDMELATYIFSSAPFLEKITMDTRNLNLLGTAKGEALFEDGNLHAKDVARQLATQLTPAAELLIL